MPELVPTTAAASFVEGRHPIYTALSDSWRFYHDSYVGGLQYTTSQGGRYLFQHRREENEDFLRRLQRSVYNNYSRKIIDIYAAFLTGQTVVRSTEDEMLESFIADADMQGHSFSRVMSQSIIPQAGTYGHVVTIVDLSQCDEPPSSLREEREQGVRPYLTTYTPDRVVDWALDEDGKYTWIRLQEDADDDTGPFAQRGEPKKQYRTWTEDAWYVHDEKGKELKSGGNPLGRVPAERCALLDHPIYPGVGQSIISDIAPLNRSIYNYRSLLDEFLFLQCFNVLGIPVPDGPQAVETVQKLIAALGTKTGLYYDSKGGPPGYISPPVSPAEFLLKSIDVATSEIIDLAKLQDRQMKEKTQSGVAHAYEFMESNAVFSAMARNLEDFERRILTLTAQWSDPSLTVETAGVTVAYPATFNLTTLGQQIDESINLLSMQISPTFDKEIKRGVVKKALPDLDTETAEQIDEEIDETPDPASVMKEMDAQLKETPERPDPTEYEEDDDSDDDATEDAADEGEDAEAEAPGEE